MLLKSIVIFGLLSVSIVSMSEPALKRVDVITCAPSDIALFAFTMRLKTGCAQTPQGPDCTDKVEISTDRYDKQSNSWTVPSIMMASIDKPAIDKAGKTLEFHSHVSQGDFVDISVSRSAVLINIQLPFGDSEGLLSTGGPRQDFVCQFL